MQPTGAPAQPGQPVIVHVHEEKKRRLNPLWLLVILLLLLLCCCGLLLIEVVEVPEFAEPYVAPFIEPFEPYLENMREMFRGFPDDTKPANKPGKPQQPVDPGNECEDFHDRVQNANDLFKGTTDCDFNKKTCEVIFDDITGLELDDYKDIGIDFQWGDGERGTADCDGKTKPLTCTFPYTPGFDQVDYFITLGICEEDFANSDGWIGEKKKEFDCGDFEQKVKDLPAVDLRYGRKQGDWGWYMPDLSDLGYEDIGDVRIIYHDSYGNEEVAECEGNFEAPRCYPFPDDVKCSWLQFGDCTALYSGDEDECELGKAQAFKLAEEPVECCEIVDVTGVRYEGTPLVTRFLHFDLEFDDCLPVKGDDCIHGETFIGADYDIPWADVTCCAESEDLDVLNCVSDHNVEQKRSRVKVELSDGECEWEYSPFQTPAYTEPSSGGDDCPSGCDCSYDPPSC